MDIARQIQMASAAHAANQFGEALRLCAQVLEVEPNNVQALMLSGVLEVKVGDPQKAVRLLNEVQGLEPMSFQAPFWQSMAFKKLGKPLEAVQSARQAHGINPKDPQGITQLGMCLIEVRLLKEAEEKLREALALAPEVIPIQYSLCQCLHMQGKRKEASEIMRRALAGSNQNADNLLNLAQFLLQLNNASGAKEVAAYAVKLAPKNPVAKLLLARILLEDGQAAEADQLLQDAIQLGSTDPQVYGLLGTSAQALGRLEEAVAAFEKSIELSPDQGYAYFALVNSRKVTSEDEAMIEKMQFLAQSGKLPPKQISFLYYGIGKALEDLGKFEAALTAWDRANEIEYSLKFGERVFDSEIYADSFDRTTRQFTRSFITKNSEEGNPSTVPIFVVGMMRSGTTLIEQILTCHPTVGSGGEQPYWVDNWREGLHETRGTLDPQGLNDAAQRYLDLLQEIAPGKPHVVDKMPVNYAGLGLIHLAFPKAKIVHMKRDPVDTCLSIYATPNRAITEYGHNRANIVEAYRQYLRIVKHWRSILPSDIFLEVDYEDLVTNPDPVTRQIVEFCGLEWDDACLKPYENKRPVVTPSVWQVRQPLYGTSVQRWRRYEPWLGAFQDLLPN